MATRKMYKNKIFIKTLILLLISTLIISTVYAIGFYYDETGEEQVTAHYLDPRIPGWYDVADWELDTCKTWGGFDAPQIARSGTELNDNIGGLTMSVQAYKIDAINPDDPEGGYTLYEASWIFIPASEEVEYKLTLVGSGSSEELTSWRGADSLVGDSGYEAMYSAKDFTHVQINIKAITKTMLKVPIVEKNRPRPCNDESDCNSGWACERGFCKVSTEY